MELALCDWEKEIKKRSALKHHYTEKELVIILKKWGQPQFKNSRFRRGEKNDK